MTIDEALETAGRELDQIIEHKLQILEERIRGELAATGPEDEEALDRPPDPDSHWQRITVEEALIMERERLLSWRTEALATLRRQLEESRGSA